MTGELKPCLKCQSSNVAFSQVCTDGGWGVLCRDCHLSLDARAETQELAAIAWNTRPREEALEAEVGRLRALLEPFAEAARLGIAGGYPPFHFVAADDYDRARVALSHPKGADDGC